MALLRNDSKFLDGKKIASENFVLDNINIHNNEENPHGVTKSDVGLSNVSNVLQASKEEFDGHINSTLHVSVSDRENWNNKQGSITAGNNITIFGNRISATDTIYDIADLLHDGLMSKEDKNKLVRSSDTLDYTQLEKGDYFNLETLTSFMVTESEQHIPLVNTSTQGLMSGLDKIKLDGIAAGAQINPSIATKAEAETGSNNAKMMTALRVKEAINVHYNDKGNPHNVTKAQIGLSNVVDELQATKDEFDTHTSSSTHITSLERNTWNAKQNALGFTPENSANKGKPNGYASLDAGGKIPAAELPSYVDDVVENTTLANLPTTGETGKIYVTINDNKTYRWSGSGYVEISASLALGNTSSTAYRGDLGQVAYTHSQTTTGNPHNVNKTDVGLSAVINAEQATKAEFNTHVGDSSHITTAERNAWNAKQGNLTAGTNVTISGGIISAIDTVYDDSDIQSHIVSKVNPHGVTKAHVGLANVDNTSDINKPVSSAVQSALDNKVDNSQVLTDVPANAKFTDTVYTHPNSHPASMITETSTKRFVTDSEKSTWNNKQNALTAGTNITISGNTISSAGETYNVATTSVDGLMASTDKSKLDGIATGAQTNPFIASQVEALTGTNNTNMMTPLRTKEVILESALVVVNHDTNSSMARPSGASVVYWIGTVEPTNATNNDLWVGG